MRTIPAAAKGDGTTWEVRAKEDPVFPCEGFHERQGGFVTTQRGIEVEALEALDYLLGC